MKEMLRIPLSLLDIRGEAAVVTQTSGACGALRMAATRLDREERNHGRT